MFVHKNTYIHARSHRNAPMQQYMHSNLRLQPIVHIDKLVVVLGQQ